MYLNILLPFVLVTIFDVDFSLQNCPEEVSWRGMSVTWLESKPGTSVVSKPLCYNKGRLVTRYCNASGWFPSLQDLEPCFSVVEVFDLSSCPPGYEQLSKTDNRYCYKIGDQSNWNYPCLRNGGASIITDLTTEEFDSLLKSLKESNPSRYFWLPAQRRKTFSPVVWNIPGPNWGQVLDSAELMSFPSMIRRCLVLDVEKGIFTTETCTKQYPSLCIYLEDIEYPAKCPTGYYGFRFMSDNGTCFGIQNTEDSKGLTFDDFLNGKCNKPMGNSVYSDLSKFIFMKIVENDQLPDDTWCWFQNMYNKSLIIDNQTPEDLMFQDIKAVINNNGTIGLMSASTHLPCMACETQMVHYGDPELDLEFSPNELKLYLTIYFPSGLWKYDNYDIGVQCFSDAKGFSTTVDVEYIPYMETSTPMYKEDTNSTHVEKSVYVVDLVTNRSAQYWCEAHNKSFSLLTSSKVVVNPTSNQLHVFALVIKINLFDNETVPQLDEINANLTNFIKAEKVIIMDILEYHVNYLIILLHVHVTVSELYEDKVSNVQVTYESLESKIISYVNLEGYILVNMSSSQYCFPTTSNDSMLLEWELTIIGQVAAPKQFCLQSNGLPVKRNCLGSYLLGGSWGEVEGQCNETYEPSNTTTFLYKFVKGQVPESYISRFLIDGLEFVLNDVDIIIPADIYYLSMSLQTILNMAQTNDTVVDMGDVDNIAWAMDRILTMDIDYLRLSQTFNSTNVILDSVNDILEKLAETDVASEVIPINKVYQLSVKPQFTVQISYPAFNNITGIAISKLTEFDNFTDMRIQPLYANSTVDDVLSIENLEIATWLPSIVLKTLQKITNDSDGEFQSNKDIHIVINIYHNDAIFQELDDSRHTVNSRIVGITIPGYKTNLVNYIPLLFKELKQTNSVQRCGFWNFQSKKQDSNPGFWSNRGCFYEKSLNNITICRCYHLTHFGQLFDIGELRPGGNKHNKCHLKALNAITLAGSFLSLFGIIGIFITAMVFQTWRKKPSTKVLLQLSTAIALPLVIMIIFNLDNTMFYKNGKTYSVRENKEITCIVLGSLLHYSILASFTWMLITAVLQFIRYVRVLGVCRPSRFMFKFALIGWGVPSVPVILVLALNYETYIPDPTSQVDKRICYPSGIYFVMGVMVPVAVVLIINVILFLMVLISISHGPEGKMKTSDMDLIGTQIRLSLFLFFLLGLTWIFGLFSFSGNLLWSYLFCLTSTLQGFVLFIYFVICDPATRSLWVTLMKPQFLASTPRKSISSISSS